MDEKMSKILMESPPGHFDCVLKNITALKPGSQYNETLSQYEAKNGRIYLIAIEEGEKHPLVSTLKEQLLSHQEKFFSATGVSMGYKVESNGNNIFVSSYSELDDKTNCFSGSWFSQWKVKTDSASEALVSGKVIIKAYAYDNSNMQLQTTEDFGDTAVAVEGNDLSKSFVAQISLWEQQVMDSLQQLHDEMNDKLKSLRRVLPVTRTKMDWNVITHRMVKILGEVAE